MIILTLDKAHEWKAGEVIHLRVVDFHREVHRNVTHLQVEDITPLRGAEPDGYGCHICGGIRPAKPDGSLPEGWTEKKYQEGSCFICSDEECQQQPICRVCGCTNEHGCLIEGGPGEDIITVCHWAEPDLCSACAKTRTEQ